MKPSNEDQQTMRPPRVFIVPFTLLTIPAFIVGTLYEFITIGFMSGRAGVFHIYFAERIAQDKRKREEELKRRGDELAEELSRALKETMGDDVEVMHLDAKRKDDKE